MDPDGLEGLVLCYAMSDFYSLQVPSTWVEST